MASFLKLFLVSCIFTAYVPVPYASKNVKINVGPVTIKEFGQDVERYVVSTDPKGIIVDGSTIILPHNAQVQIAVNGSFNNTYSPDMYREYILQNRTISYTTDISSIGCSCNAAFYFASMPGYAANGEPNPGAVGNYYCDANDAKEFCWEMDVMEANKYVLQVTPHRCSSAPGGYIDSCDGAGCCTNSWVVNTFSICPNSSCMINTMNPFRLSITFQQNTSISVSLTQGTSSFNFDACWFITDYLQAMQQAFNYGMVMIMSYWGDTWDTMNWLDRMTGCAGDCDVNGQAIFSDIEIS